jgi:glutaredoxin 3
VRIVVYSGPSCFYCLRAKRLLRERGITFEEIDVAADSERQAAMIQASGRRTVPQIFIDGRPIGGYDELAALDREGALASLISPGTDSSF